MVYKEYDVGLDRVGKRELEYIRFYFCKIENKVVKVNFWKESGVLVEFLKIK